MERLEMELGGRKLIIETGRLAKLADGAVTVQYGDTIVLVTVVASREVREGVDYLPLYVDYREKTYAAGKIPGGFFKREGRPTEKEILTARLIDRPHRPLFPSGFRNEVQIMAVVLSADPEHDPDMLAIIGGSAALALSDIPFPKPIGAVRVGRNEGKLIINPTHAQIAGGDLDLVVAGTKDGINMVEGEAKELSGEVIQEAILFGHRAAMDIASRIEEFSARAGKEKRDIPLMGIDAELKKRVESLAGEKIAALMNFSDKQGRQEQRRLLTAEVLTELAPDFPDKEKEIKGVLEELEAEEMRKAILDSGKRADGRQPAEIRPISCEVGILPRAHGSAVFSRGQTQSLVTTTLGTSHDEQMLDGLKEESFKSFMQRRRDKTGPRPGKTGDRTRGSCRAGLKISASSKRGVSLYHSHRFRHPGIERFLFHGYCLWRFSLPYGRRSSYQSLGGRHCHGIGKGRAKACCAHGYHRVGRPFRRYGF